MKQTFDLSQLLRGLRRLIFLGLVLTLGLLSPSLAAEKPLSPKDRTKIFDQVWQIIRDKYYSPQFNGVNWHLMRERYRPQAQVSQTDAEFYQVLRQLVGELRDTHTRVHTPEERERRERKHNVTAGVRIYEVEGQPLIISVAANSEAAQAGIRPGMRVLAVDGVNITDKLQQLQAQLGGMSSARAEKSTIYSRLLRGEAGSSLSLTLENLQGRPFTVSLKRRTINTSGQVSVRRLNGGYGYIRISSWEDSVAADFAVALVELRDTPGLVIDLRGNGGGEAGLVFEIASLFFKDRVSFGKFITRKGKVTEIFTKPRKKLIYEGPLTILVDEVSASGSELFAGVMQEYRRAKVIGRTSCGCLLVIQNLRKLRGGGELTVSELDVQTPAGRRLEGTGVIPDQVVPLTREDLLLGRDTELNQALEILVALPRPMPRNGPLMQNPSSRP